MTCPRASLILSSVLEGDPSRFLMLSLYAADSSQVYCPVDHSCLPLETTSFVSSNSWRLSCSAWFLSLFVLQPTHFLQVVIWENDRAHPMYFPFLRDDFPFFLISNVMTIIVSYVSYIYSVVSREK